MSATEQPTRPSQPPSLAARTGNVLVTLAAAALAVGFSLVAKLAIELLTGGNAGFVVYVPAVAAAAWYRGLLGGILATGLSALVDTLIFIPPMLVVVADLRDEQIRLLAYLTGGLAVSYLSHLLRTERDRARHESAERRRALEDAAEAREELDRLVATERRAIELREAFNGIISHELRTPITALYAGAKLLARRDRQLDPAIREDLIDDMEVEADRLYRLVEDLLVLSRSERGTIERSDDPVVVQHVAERVVGSERQRWPMIEFEVSSRASSTASGDEAYVEQVLRNLISNAAKYSPSGGTVSVAVDEASEGVRTRVLDQGRGIEPTEADRLFELYYRSPSTSATVSGAGIGLFVCRALVEAMDGRIWAAPREGGGAEFGFILARLPDEPAS